MAHGFNFSSDSQPRIAVLGAHGQLGSELCRQLGSAAVPVDRSRCELTRRDDVLRTLDEIAPDVVINTAAYNLVDRAEEEPETCRAANADAVGHIAEACRRLNCTLVQVSTAYVFDGHDRSVPYRESEPAHPISEYGRSKLEGEHRAAEHSRHLIVRAGPMLGPRPPQAKTTNFVDLMLRLGQTQPIVRVVNDQRCSPSHVRDIAKAIRVLLAAEKSGMADYDIYHLAGRQEATWHELAAEIFRRMQLPAMLVGVSTAEFAAAAPRPHYAVLDTKKYRALGGPEPRAWPEALTEYLAELGDSWRLATDLAR